MTQVVGAGLLTVFLAALTFAFEILKQGALEALEHANGELERARDQALEAARAHAAEAEQRAGVEGRHDDVDVGQVRAAAIGVVMDEDIALGDVIVGESGRMSMMTSRMAPRVQRTNLVSVAGAT
jgi:hypothetical protein